MLKKTSKAIMLFVSATVISAASVNAMAETHWEKTHPARDQVNDRLHNQNRRIHKEVKEGDLTRQQARQLHQSDRSIRQEERSMANQNGGHITRQQQATLNQQENAVSQQIGR